MWGGLGRKVRVCCLKQHLNPLVPSPCQTVIVHTDGYCSCASGPPCPCLQVHPTMARELFAAGFVSCWADLEPALQEQLVRSLEASGARREG